MPYIRKENRVKFEAAIKALPVIEDAGELNFIITKILQEYMRGTKKNYAIYNNCIGALECAKIELYRRQIADYENLKIKENSDCY